METIRIDRDEQLPGLTTITLSRPDKLNAINVTMHEELQQACRDLQDDFDTRVVIVTGEGRAFSSGAELSSRQGGQPQSDLDRRLRVSMGDRTSAALEGLDQVTIAAVNGLAIGGAVVFLSCLDMRLAAESAWFSIPEVDLELPLTWGALPRLMRELGPARTKELVLLCDRFSAREALEWGFLNRVYPDDQVLPEARKLAERILAMDPLAVAMTKSATNAMARLMVPAESSHAEREQMLLAYQMRRRRTEDQRD